MDDLMDISSELYRVYEWIGGYKVTIPNPVGMKKEADGYLILDRQGKYHYIADGWVHLCMELREKREK